MKRMSKCNAVAIVVGLAVFTLMAGCQQMCRRCGKTVKVTVLDGVLFDFNKTAIRPDGKVALDKDVELLKKDNTLDISIEGHCDFIGSDEYNQRLSERRAKVVFDYFAGKGIDAKRMKTVGYGRKKPIAPNETPEGRAKNRRVEVNIIKARP